MARPGGAAAAARRAPASGARTLDQRVPSSCQTRLRETEKLKFKNQSRWVRADQRWGPFLNQKHDAVEPAAVGSRKSLLVFIFGSKIGVQKFLKIKFDFGLKFRGSGLISKTWGQRRSDEVEFDCKKSIGPPLLRPALGPKFFIPNLTPET